MFEILEYSIILLSPRVGWSIDEAGLGLGEAEFSYGYGSTGMSVVNNHYNEYGETYGPGDIIGCFVVSVGWRGGSLLGPRDTLLL